MSKKMYRLWKRWERGVLDIVNCTSQYVESSAEIDPNLITQWISMVARTSQRWSEELGVPIFWAYEEGEDEPHIIEDDDEPEIERGFFGLFIS